MKLFSRSTSAKTLSSSSSSSSFNYGTSRRRVKLSSDTADQRFAVLVALLAVLVSFVGLCVRFAPVFTVSILGILAIVLMFVSTERSKTHAFIEFQNRFWSFAAFLVAWVCFFIRDSPLCFADQQRTLAWFMVFVVSYTAHTYHRWLVRRWLYIVPPLPRTDSADLRSELKISARQKIAAINSHIPTIDNPLVSSTFQNIFNIFNVLHAEESIISIFLDATQDELNFILQHIKLGLILYKMKDHKWWRRYNRDKLMRVLAGLRLHELDERAKVYLLHGIQSLTLSASETCEKHVEKILCSTKSDKLSELKSLADAKGDVHNMHKLVYEDITSSDTKRRILAHIKTQAEIIKAHHDMRSKNKMQALGQYAWRKIISDVDDTLTCSGGAQHSFGLAGVDVSYPSKTVYPGVLAFYRELDLGISGSGMWDNTKVGNLVFLSARPHVYKDATEGRSYEKFQKLRARGLHTMPTLLAGALDTGLKFAYGGDSEPLAVTKYKNLGEYLALYPEYKVVFIGDNGQGDVRAAEMALMNPAFASNISRVYVHLVQPSMLTHRGSSLDGPAGKEKRTATNSTTPSATAAGTGTGLSPSLREAEARQRAKNEAERMCFFITYVDAALDAQRLGLIRTSGLRNVMSEARRDFEDISPEAWLQDEERMRLLARNKQMGGQGVGGKIIPQHSKPGPKGGSAQMPLTPTVSSVWACQGENKRDTRIRELNLSLQRGNEVLVTAGLLPVPLLPRKLVVGSRAKTEYGVGVVTRIRKLSPPGAEPGKYYGATYEMIAQWDCTGQASPVRLYQQDWSLVTLPPVALPPPASRYFRAGASKPQPVLLSSAVNLPTITNSNMIFSSAAPLTGGRGRLSSAGGMGTPVATPNTATTASKFGIGLLTRENVAAMPTAKPLVPLYEKGEGSLSSLTSISGRDVRDSTGAKSPTTIEQVPAAFAREEDVPTIDVVVQTSVFRPSVMDRARAPALHRGRNRARSSSNVSSEDGTGQSSIAGADPRSAERDLSGMRGAQAWTPYGLVQLIGYVDDETRKDCVTCRLHGPGVDYVDLFLQRSCVVQLTDPLYTTCYLEDDAVGGGGTGAILLEEPKAAIGPTTTTGAGTAGTAETVTGISTGTFESLASTVGATMSANNKPLAKPAPSRPSTSSWGSSWFSTTVTPVKEESLNEQPSLPESPISTALTSSILTLSPVPEDKDED